MSCWGLLGSGWVGGGEGGGLNELLGVGIGWVGGWVGGDAPVVEKSGS